MKLETGDIVFVKGTSFISNLIRKTTFGEVTHVGILYDDKTVFETDGKWGKAEFHDLLKYAEKEIAIYRYRYLYLPHKSHIKALCEEYEGAPYSYWDVVLKGLLFWLHPRIRGKITKVLGTTTFMICNELVMRILHQATGHEVFENYESSNPAEFLLDVEKCTSLFTRVL